MLVNCTICGKKVKRKPSQLKEGRKVICSKECKVKSLTTSIIVSCSTCGKEAKKAQSEIKKSKSGKLFCSHSCSATSSNTERSNQLYTYRKIAFDNFAHKCDICGYDDVINILQVHHKDRDRFNNVTNNLQILCPTCHTVEHFNKKDGMYSFLKD